MKAVTSAMTDHAVAFYRAQRLSLRGDLLKKQSLCAAYLHVVASLFSVAHESSVEGGHYTRPCVIWELLAFVIRGRGCVLTGLLILLAAARGNGTSGSRRSKGRFTRVSLCECQWLTRSN